MGLITIDYRDRKLIYEQLIDNVKALLIRGDLAKDDFLPSVRSLSRELGINPNTIQKAYAELERQGVIATLPGRGSVIVKDRADVAGDGVAGIRGELSALAARARALGVTKEDFIRMAGEIFEKEASIQEEGSDV